MLDAFDVVGLTERFAETLLHIARLSGIPNVQYRRMNTARVSEDRDLIPID